MFFEWWMIAVAGIVWGISLVSYGNTSFYQGAYTTIESLQEGGYIKIKEPDGEIIGLCNRDQENFEDK